MWTFCRSMLNNFLLIPQLIHLVLFQVSIFYLIFIKFIQVLLSEKSTGLFSFIFNHSFNRITCSYIHNFRANFWLQTKLWIEFFLTTKLLEIHNNKEQFWFISNDFLQNQQAQFLLLFFLIYKLLCSQLCAYSDEKINLYNT